jgi:hypothetical protein
MIERAHRSRLGCRFAAIDMHRDTRTVRPQTTSAASRDHAVDDKPVRGGPRHSYESGQRRDLRPNIFPDRIERGGRENARLAAHGSCHDLGLVRGASDVIDAGAATRYSSAAVNPVQLAAISQRPTVSCSDNHVPGGRCRVVSRATSSSAIVATMFQRCELPPRSSSPGRRRGPVGAWPDLVVPASPIQIGDWSACLSLDVDNVAPSRRLERLSRDCGAPLTKLRTIFPAAVIS